MTRCSTLLIVWETQIKTTIRYHLTLVRMVIIKKSTNNKSWDFPCGPAVKNPPANAGDTSLIPGLGRSHVPWGSWAHASQLLSLCSRALEPRLLSPHAQLLKPVNPRACAPQQEKPQQWGACVPQPESSPLLPQLEKSPQTRRIQHSQK